MKALLPLLLVAGAAAAQEQPKLLPDRDVTIVYRLGGAAAESIPGGAAGSVRVAWSAAGQRLRAEPEGRPQSVLVELGGAPSVKVVDSGLHASMSLPVRASDLQPMTLQGAHLTRRGRATVAGLACTEYAVQSSRGRGTVCLTPEGVALRANGEVDGRSGTVTAVSVSYGALPETLFRVPQGYMQLAIPGVGRHH
ncbi:MAG TPA: hypothetical protein VE650_05265 [Acetobacteraceae bacterium]|nr:hypothetical protein [Acetobacteraceae bacterium]